MLYHLFKYLHDSYSLPGSGMFQYLSFRAALALITSLLIGMVFGGRWIRYLNRKQVGETVRDLGLEGQMEKQGTPTMGGLIILSSILIPSLLFARLNNIYILLMLFTTIWLGIIGFIDDYIKVFKKDKAGLRGKYKIIGQVILGLVVGLVMYFNKNVVSREKVTEPTNVVYNVMNESGLSAKYVMKDSRTMKTTIPFLKNNEFDYSILLSWLGTEYKKWTFLIFIPIIILIITAVSNGANLTDGMDGLAAGTSAIIGTTLGILAWVSGNIIFAEYLNIMYLPNVGELSVFVSAFVGATVGFMWFNTYPAQVFMGDTGSLAIGGIIAVFAIIIRKELLIPLLCGIFLAESLSVVLQVGYFKYTKRKTGTGKRIFLMAPLHHHYQKKGYSEPKIVVRFLIVGIALAVLTVITLKVR